jgi:hypothetical protein
MKAAKKKEEARQKYLDRYDELQNRAGEREIKRDEVLSEVKKEKKAKALLKKEKKLIETLCNE